MQPLIWLNFGLQKCLGLVHRVRFLMKGRGRYYRLGQKRTLVIPTIYYNPSHWDILLYAGKRSEDFIGYVPKDTHPLRIAAFKKLGISKALLRQLSRVISDAKVMVDSPERAKDMEMLFGVMPICVLTGRLDVMREVLEAESGISSAVKAEAERYLKDE